MLARGVYFENSKSGCATRIEMQKCSTYTRCNEHSLSAVWTCASDACCYLPPKISCLLHANRRGRHGSPASQHTLCAPAQSRADPSCPSHLSHQHLFTPGKTAVLPLLWCQITGRWAPIRHLRRCPSTASQLSPDRTAQQHPARWIRLSIPLAATRVRTFDPFPHAALRW